MRYLYSFGILIYSLIIRLFSLFNPKAKLWYNGRKNVNFEELKSLQGCILIQCSSLGEFEQGKPLINALKIKYPNQKIVLSFFSPSGFEAKKNIKEVDKVIYLPIDTPRKTHKFVNCLKPKMAFFIKYDFWPNLFIALRKSNCKIYLISTIFRPKQAFFKWYGIWYKKTLNLVDFFFVQNETSKNLLASIDLTNVMVTGDTRFDQVLSVKKEHFNDSIIESFIHSSPNIVVAGSTWIQDERLILKCLEKFPNWKWIIAPHEINKSHIKELKDVFKGIQFTTYTQSTQTFDNQAQVLIVDTIGILKYLYRYGSIAYVGGGFGKGIHNTLEPAAYGIPILFGPNHYKFQEAQDLIASQIGFEINENSILEIFGKATHHTEREQIEVRTQTYIAKQKGAINKIMNYLT